MNTVYTTSSLLPERLAAKAQQTPHLLAVSAGDHQLTFAELNGRANQLARLLQQQDIGLESVVGVCLERSIEMVVALLAVLKAGAAYVPIDPGYPADRIKWMLDDAETAVCLTHSQLAHKLPESAQDSTIFLDQFDFILSLLPREDVFVPVQPDNLAYVIYTSGSTGRPKGAMITHRGLANYLGWALENYPAQVGGAPVHSSIGFDLTVTSLFVPLLAGQPVTLLPQGDAGSLLGQALTKPGGFGLVKITPAHLLLLNQIVPAEMAAAATQSFVIGGEQLTAEQLAFWRKHAPNTRLFNEYGPTETVVGCCVYEILPDDDLNGAVPIGRPIANTQLYVLDEQLQPLPDGEVGELYIGGEGVARGYLQRPSLTAEKFVPDPFGRVPGARLYRTGDLARLRPDGNFEFLGRIDHQVKIRGYRIELGEIEAVLGQHENVRETAVLVHETAGSKQLIAYLTPEQTPAPTTDELRDFLAQRLPDYMIPARFVLIDAMPLTINGKIDRKALPAPESVRPELPQSYAPPRTPEEETLSQIWAEVLGISPVGVHDSFFGLGGDSILGIQIVAKARAAGFDLSQAQLFQQPTVAELATSCTELAEAAVSITAPVAEPAEAKPLLTLVGQSRLQTEFGDRFVTAYPLSPLQEGILFHTLLHPEDDIYFEQPAFTIEGELDPEMLMQAWQQVVARHPILRTVFVWEGWERPLQIVLQNAPPRSRLLDWRDLSAGEQAGRMAQLLADNRAAGLSLEKPPHHLTLIRLSEQETRFIWAVHHIIIDGWTESLLYKELFSLYEAMVWSEQAELPDPEPFESFIRWQQQQDWTDAKHFWQEVLSGFVVPTPLTIDLGRRTGHHRAETHGEIRRQLPTDLHEQLKQFGRQHGLTLGTLLQAAWGLLLSRYSGEPDVVFGTMMSGRVPQLPGVDQIAGVLINPAPLRCRIAPEDTVLPWLKQFQRSLLALQQHETTPLTQVQSWSALPADQPLFESLLVLENYPRQRHAAGKQLTIRDYFSYERTNYPLTLRLVPDEGLDVFLVFDADRLAEAAVSRLFDHYCNLLAGMVVDGERPLSQLPLITEAEAQQLIVEWNNWDTHFTPASCIHQEFERQVTQSPNAVAVTFGNDQLTYAELNAKANQLAHFLQQQGVQPDDLVALYLERSLEMVIAILGVLKAGGAYLPIDTAYPEDRLAFMLEDAKPVALLTQEKLVASSKWQVASGRRHVAGENSQFTIHNSQFAIKLDTDWPQIAGHPATNPTSAVQPHNRAYVIYTSGSTGKPKGVLVTHYNVMRLMQATDNWYHFDQNDVWTLFHSYAFDFSVWEIWGALLVGGRLVVVPYLTSRSPHDFYRLLVDEGVTVLNQTPSAFRQLIQAEAEAVSGNQLSFTGELALRYVIFGGEALELNTLQPWFDRHGDQKPQLINMYGITETTVHVTYRPIFRNDVAQAPGSVIGQPIPDLQLFILDPQQRPVPIGVPGEIYVGGAGVAAGYLNRPELTAEKFLENLFDKVKKQPVTLSPAFAERRHLVTRSRLYRTGDLARWLPDGDIEYRGRIDHQVKIRGFRIELGEIEAALGSHTAVRQLLVLVREDEPGEKRLVAYLVLDPEQSVTVSELRRHLQPRLPAYMIPAAFVLLDAFPLTTNGKIDRRALPAPDETRPELERPYTPPRTRAEEILAGIWSRVLGAARVGIDDNYFELGGDSIRSIQVLAQARQAGLNFSLADLFNLQTIGRLSEQFARIELVEAGVAVIEAAPFSLISQADRSRLPSEVEDAYPLSKLQAGMLFHVELAAATAASAGSVQAVYHNVTSWQIEGVFDGRLLQTAVQQLAQKHTILRTSFDLTTYSEPLQLVWPQVRIPVTLHDLRRFEVEAQEVEINRWVQQTVAEKFDWTQPPLLRFHFFRCSATRFQMIMAEHHAILDGWSVASLVTELFQTYRALLAGVFIGLGPAIPYRKFVAAEQAILTSDRSRAFWQENLAESSVSTVPRLPLPEVDDNLPETAVHQTIIPAEQVSQLNQVAQRAGVPLKSVLLAAHLKVLSFVCGQNEVVSGLVMNGRPEQSGSERALGLFLNTVPFRQKLADGSWLDLVRQTFATEKMLLPHRRFPLAEMQQMMGGQPLFEVPFNYLHFHVFDELADGNEIKILGEQFYGHANFDLAVEAELNSIESTLALRLEYNPAQFGAAHIERLAGYFERALAALAAEPDAAHHTFSPLSTAELQTLLVDWNETETAVPHQLIHEWVAQVAEERGRKTAVTYHNQQLTYAQLNAKANHLAHFLQTRGVGPETIVAVYLNRSPEMVIAALAVLKAGAAYLPLDPAYPPERIHFMLTDAKSNVLLTQEQLVTGGRRHAESENLPLTINHLPLTIKLDSDWAKINSCSDENPSGGATAENAAYIIYTSGSTGQPKGVVVTHRGLPNLAQAQHKAFAIGPESRVLQFAAFGFDASVSEMFVTLTTGATLVLAEAEEMLPGPDLVALVKEQGITAVTLPPSALAILNPDDFPSLQTVVAAGEACSAEVMARWSAGRRFVNGYGPTEATVCATTAVLTPDDANPHIGRPIDNVQLFILNEAQQLVPIGTPGELYIGGIGVARGYLNRPGLTAEKFIENLYDKVTRGQGDKVKKQSVTLSPGHPVTRSRFYRTGDLARYLPNGNVDFLGRLDHQVKVRGYRIELGEIETVLRRQTAVQDALVMARDDARTGPQLVAYIVGPNADAANLRATLSRRLPAYMVPSSFVLLDAFPLTPNGKIDRKALPAPMAATVTEYTPPRNDLETVIANVWAKVLKRDRVGVHDNFFELGGHSLLATQLVARLRQMLRIELSLRALFAAPTVAGLAQVVQQPPMADEGLAETAVTPTIPPRAQEDQPLPLSFAQQRLWFLDALTPGSSLFNTPLALRLTGRLDETALTQACHALVQRHESLRTTFTAVAGTPQQIIHDKWPVTLNKMSVSADELDDVLQTAVQHPFDLEKGPLLRFYLLQLEEDEHILLLVFHHIIFDGWSAGIVVDELVTLYEAISNKRQPDLPELPVQYADFALWQRDWLTGETLQAQLDYWREQLAGELPLLQLPTDRPRPAVKTHNGAVETVMLSPELIAQIMALCKQSGSTPFMLLLAAFKVLLHRYTAQEDILVGTPIANRQQPEVEGLVGFFVNTLVLRSRVNGRQTFRQLLAQVRHMATTAYEHPDVPFEKLVELLQPERNLSFDPLFQVMFSFQYQTLAERPLPNLTVTPIDLNNGIAQFDLDLELIETGDGLMANFHYNVDLFDSVTVTRLAGHFLTLLQSIVADPEQRIGLLPLLTSAEQQQLLRDWNNTAVPYNQEETILDRFAAQVANQPQATAVATLQQQQTKNLTYAQLNSRANQLAHTLKSLGVRPNAAVAVCLERSPDMIVALLGILKTGAAYVPIDPVYPQQRIDFILRDTAAKVILTQASLQNRLGPWQIKTLCLDVDWQTIGQADEVDPKPRITPDYTAYIMYTSGSTGQPKGVLISHRSLYHYVTVGMAHVELQPEDTVLQFASISFDVAVEEIFSTLAYGARLLLRDDAMIGTTARFWQTCAANGVTILDLPTAYWHLLCMHLSEDAYLIPASLRLLFIGGEKASIEHIQSWRKAAPPEVKLVNGYGPTEATILETFCVVAGQNSLSDVSRSIIGCPIPNTSVYIVDNQMQPVPVGVWGELYIGGVGLAHGYLNRPDLTAVNFLPDPFGGKLGERLYKTGDNVRYLPDGNIEFRGRLDNQVKVRGFRIELGEIEAALRQHTAVQDALVLARETDSGLQLVAYVVGDEEELRDLRPFLNQFLPAYMVPAAFIFLEKFPQTPNGKIDRKALPAPDSKPGSADGTFVAPQDALESQLLQVWQDVLKLTAISTDANYFELGGHSLQAVTLFAAIEKRLKLRLPVSLLFEAPTVTQLADAIRRRGETPKWSSLVPIQPLGRKTPLFCVHGGAGHVFHYRDLAQLLGTERPFYGLQPVLDKTTHQSLFTDVEEMAAHYIQEIKMVQPEGPYLLSGFCFGGIVVYEMAQQLKRAGEEVGLLVFIDPSTPQNKPSVPQADSAEEIADRLARHKSNLAQLGRLARLRYILNSSKNRLKGYWHGGYRAWVRYWRNVRARLIQQYINRWQVVPTRFSDFYFMHVISTQATQSYRPQRYPGEAILFYSTLENDGDKSLGWSDLPEEGLQMYAVESTHLGILKRPYIDQVAAELKQQLEPFA